MEFILNWEMDNRNNFEYNIDEFIYDFKVNNRQWANSRGSPFNYSCTRNMSLSGNFPGLNKLDSPLTD